jgi:uncharacterized short protein YbdD (DUF466 family)
VREWLNRGGRALRDVWSGVSGLHEYESYVEHSRRHHPESPVLSREEFFRRELTARWNGVRRCC